jgi:enediyne biosynthesis protein E4
VSRSGPLSQPARLGAIALSFCVATTAAQLSWDRRAGYRHARLTATDGSHTGFALIPAAESGLFFTNVLSQARALANANLMNGSGVALGDYDADGLCDVYFCNLDGENALYKNLGNFKFQDVTAEAGVACPNQNSTGAVFADIDGNGTLDLLVTSLGGPNSCFLNAGGGKFVDASAASGITSRLGATTMALADIDGNGTLDLYIANYGATSIIRSGGALNVSYVNGKPIVRGRYAQRVQIIDNMMFELGEADALYLNDGKGVFKAVSWTNGIFSDPVGKPLREAPWDQGLSAMFFDVNGDRAPDLYVCNDAFTPDRFWINDGQGRFRALPRVAWPSTSHFSMGVDFADFDRDGDFDFFVVDMLSRQHQLMVTQKGNMPLQRRLPGDLSMQVQMRRNTLFQNRGDATYAEIAFLSGVAGSEWSWAGNFIDVDLDGWEDILVSNGFPFNMDDIDSKQKVRAMGQLSVEQSRRSLLIFPPLLTPNMAFRNERNLSFSDVSSAWNFNSTNISNGFAFADLDNDGDLDTVVNCLNGPALLYRNESPAPRIGVRLKGKAPNTQGIGAAITVHGGPVVQSQQVICGGRYVSCDDPMRVFACGTNATKLRIEVVWRNGTRTVVENAEANHIYEIDEGAAQKFQPTGPAEPTPLFTDVSAMLNHKHHETFFNDFEIQPSLPNRLSQLGPGVTCFDLDDDGWDDLLIGSGRGGQIAGFHNERGKIWTPMNFHIPATEDISTILARRSAPGVTELIVGFCTYETSTTNHLLIYELRGTNLVHKQTLPTSAAIGPLAITELRGEMVLFAGGRFVPRRYPEPAPSYLFILRDAKWTEEKSVADIFSRLGLASAALWSDLNSDGTPELVVACEWGSLRIFDFSSGSVTEKTKEWGLDQLVGRWQSVAASDVDSDGRMDLIAGNWGANSFYHQSADHQTLLYYGDFNGQDRIEMLEAYRSTEDANKVVPWRDMQLLSSALPWLPQKFDTHAAFARATVAQILAGRKFTEIQTTTLHSTVILNRDPKAEILPLPLEAQYTPVFGIAARDLDNDGFTDIALAQNFFALRDEDGSLDAGRSLLLRGASGGKLTAVPAFETGLIAYGEQRALAALDFNQDGTTDLVLAQNGGETRLFENKSRKPGIRLRLRGSATNPDTIGAQIRTDDGPLLEIQCGSGYWSQNSLTQILPPTAKNIHVRWPTGKKTAHMIPAGSKDLLFELK